MINTQHSAFARLRSAWKRHDGVRRDPASVRDLTTSRRIGDEVRLDMWRVRGN